MKNALVSETSLLASDDPRIVVLNADSEDSLFDKFKAAQPGQYYNTSMAGSNTISLAAGLASCGLLPVCYTLAPFVTSRCYEQIKLDVCYHSMPVVIIGADTGLSSAAEGVAFQSLHDIASMRTLPGMRVLAPADPMELRSCLRAALSENGPTYIRIGKKGESAFFPARPTFSFGVWKQVRQGSRVTLLATGSLLSVAMKAADLLEQTSLCPRVCSCASIKPLDTAALLRFFSSDELVVTIEEHTRVGGFGSAVAEWLADTPNRLQARLLRLGTDDNFLHSHSDHSHAREACQLSPAAIASAVSNRLGYHR
jgi:transketolase